MFSLVSVLITFRETLEAALIVGILLVYVRKIEKRRLKKQIWLGTVSGIIISIIFALLFQLLLGEFNDYKAIFEGITMIFASLLLGWMIVWMGQEGRQMKEKLEQRIDQTIEERKKYGILFLSFLSVLREGVETVLFLSGVEAIENNYFGMLWSGMLGIALALLVTAIVFLSGKKVNIRLFFIVTRIVLVLFAAGMFTYGIHELQEVSWFGPPTHWLQKKIWDTSSILDDKNSELGKFLRALFGYQDQPTSLEIIAYLGYFVSLVVTLATILIITKKKPKGTKK